MSNIASITVFDGAATPVTHTLTPVSVSRKENSVTATWRENTASLPLEACIRLTVTLTQLNSGIIRKDTIVEVPVMETILNQNAAGYTASPKVAYIDKDVYTKYMHPRSTTNSRRLSRQILVNLMGNVSTSVAAATAGFIPEAADLAIAPT